MSSIKKAELLQCVFNQLCRSRRDCQHKYPHDKSHLDESDCDTQSCSVRGSFYHGTVRVNLFSMCVPLSRLPEIKTTKDAIAKYGIVPSMKDTTTNIAICKRVDPPNGSQALVLGVDTVDDGRSMPPSLEAALDSIRDDELDAPDLMRRTFMSDDGGTIVDPPSHLSFRIGGDTE